MWCPMWLYFGAKRPMTSSIDRTILDWQKKILDLQENSRSSLKFSLTKYFSIGKIFLDRRKNSIDKIISRSTKKFSTSKKIVWPMKKFSRFFKIFLNLPQTFLVRENYFSTNGKVFSIVKDISGPSNIYLERPNYFSADKIILDQYGFPRQ